MLKEFYSRSKTSLKLVSLRSNSNSRNIERTNFLGDVDVITMKDYYSNEKLSESSESDVKKTKSDTHEKKITKDRGSFIFRRLILPDFD